MVEIFYGNNTADGRFYSLSAVWEKIFVQNDVNKDGFGLEINVESRCRLCNFVSSNSNVHYISYPTTYNIQGFFSHDMFRRTNDRCCTCGQNGREFKGSITRTPVFICVDWGGNEPPEDNIDSELCLNGNVYRLLAVSYFRNSHFTARLGPQFYYDGMNNEGRVSRFQGLEQFQWSFQGNMAQMIFYKKTL